MKVLKNFLKKKILQIQSNLKKKQKMAKRKKRKETNRWKFRTGLKYSDKCPICGELMSVKTIQGTPWLAGCPNKCYKKKEKKK